MKYIKSIILGCLIGILLGIIISCINTISNQKKLIKAYNSYYNNTEILLDDLDSTYNWVDGYDNYEYYSSKAKIDSLKQQ